MQGSMQGPCFSEASQSELELSQATSAQVASASVTGFLSFARA